MIIAILLSQVGLYLHVKPSLSRYVAILILDRHRNAAESKITCSAHALKSGDPPLAPSLSGTIVRKMLPYLQKA
jgi:hypothetical protein